MKDLAEVHLQIDMNYPQALSFAGQTNVDLYITSRVAVRMFGENALPGEGPWSTWRDNLNT